MDEAEEVISSYLRGQSRCCISYNCQQIFHSCLLIENSTSSPGLDPLRGILINSEGLINLNLLSMIKDTPIHVLISFIANESRKALYSHSFVNNLSRDNIVCSALISCSVIESILLRLLELRGSPVILLKDALTSEVLLEIIPDVMVRLCQFLFLPSGLNVRNVLWHGFMTSDEFDDQLYYLLISFRCTLEKILSSSNQSLVYTNSDRLLAKMSTYTTLQSLGLTFQRVPVICFQSYPSLMILPGRELLLQSALSDYQNQLYLSCLLKMIPCLEHSLRYLFCLCNFLPEYILAQEHTYYSTLDGFGQRSKHQLLLDPFLHIRHSTIDNPEPPNLLPSLLGVGAYSLLIDLFFSENGSNLRSKLAHGEIDMMIDTRIKMDDGNMEENNTQIYLQSMASIILVLFSGLCSKFCHSSQIVVDLMTNYRKIHPTQELEREISKNPEIESPDSSIFLDCEAALDNWKSFYHPHRILFSQLADTSQSISILTKTLQNRRSYLISECRIEPSNEKSKNSVESEQSMESKIEILISDSSPIESQVVGELRIQLWEKDSRLIQLLPHQDILLMNDSCDNTSPMILSPSFLRLGMSLQSNQPTKKQKTTQLTLGFQLSEITQNCWTALMTLQNKLLESSIPCKSYDATNIIRFLSEEFMIAAPMRRPFQQFHHSALIKLSTKSILEDYIDSKLGLFSHLLPGIACCGQICKVANDLCIEACRIMSEKEESSIPIYTLNVLTVAVNLCVLAIGIVLSHIDQFSQQSKSKSQKTNRNTNALVHIYAALSSFSTCLGLRLEGVTIEETNAAKKSTEKSLQQLQIALNSKILKEFYR